MKPYILKNEGPAGTGEMVLETEVSPDSPWFSGHFPGEPVLPGVAQLEMALDAVKRLNRKGLKISRVKRVRFRRIIRPGERIRVTVASDEREASSYPFRITVNGELASRGVLVVEKSDR